MKRMFFPLLTALLLGVIGGLLISGSEVSEVKPVEVAEKTGTVVSPVFQTVIETDAEKILRLENEIISLRDRVAILEENTLVYSEPVTEQEVTQQGSGDSEKKTAIFKELSVEALTSVGVSEDIAEAIMRRSSEQEYQKLQLRDRAIREGYMNKPEYYRQLRELNANKISLRSEVGDETYDRYLYNTGQNNRVQVSSVMQGSPSELAGIKASDIVLSYGNQKIIHYGDIREVTSQGSLNEYVTVNVLRDGEVLSFMLPRGPMGIRLQATRSDPGSD